MLLQSSKPSLYANVDCNALVAAIVSRQTAVVELLLKVIIFLRYCTVSSFATALQPALCWSLDMLMVHLLPVGLAL